MARFGGDEFAILLDDSPDAPMLAERIAVALQQPFVFGSHRVHVSASIGIAASDETDATTAEQLLRNADLAMYQAKAAGACGFVVYNPRCTRAWWSASRWRPISGRRWRTTSSSSTTSR